MIESKETKSLIVGTTSPYSGKTLLCLGLGRRFIKDGLNIGYFKPLGSLPVMVDSVFTDEDAVFISKALNLSEPLDLLCPAPLTESLVADELNNGGKNLKKKVLAAHEKLSHGKDLMLVGGMGSLIEGRFIHLSGLKLVELLNANVVIVDRHEEQTYCLDHLLNMKDILGDSLVGVILNCVQPDRMDFIQKKIVPFLKRHGVDVIGIIPHDTVLSSVTVGELRDIMDGEILCCENNTECLIERLSIGAMNVDSALRFFRKTTNKAVITGGDRPDIQLAAIETSTRCLVLTGDLYPDDIIINRAKDRGIPIILVKTDTVSTIEKFENAVGRLRIRAARKIERAAQLVNDRVDFATIYKKVGLDYLIH